MESCWLGGAVCAGVGRVENRGGGKAELGKRSGQKPRNARKPKMEPLWLGGGHRDLIGEGTRFGSRGEGCL